MSLQPVLSFLWPLIRGWARCRRAVRLALALLLPGVAAQAATLSLPAAIGTAPFAGCSLSSGTLYVCPAGLSIGNNMTLQVTAPMTLRVTGNITIGNNSDIVSNGNAFTLIATGGIEIGNSFLGTVNLQAGGNIQLGNTATLNGNVDAGGDLSAGNKTTINGYCTYQTTNITCNTPPTGPDHYELALPSLGVACLPSTVTVTACADASSPCTSPYTAASGTTVSLSASGGTLGAGTLSFNASGVATTTLSHPSAADGATVSVSLSATQQAAANVPRCCPDGVACAAAASCATTFRTAGFVLSASVGGAAATVPPQVAGTSSGPYYLRAVRTGSTAGACAAALTGTTDVRFALQCTNPAACDAADRMQVNGTPVAGNPASGVTRDTAVALNFDAGGNAPLSFAYGDVGRVRLVATKAAGGTLLAPLAGASNAFVVAPATFSFSALSPGPIGAGRPFSATVTARTSTGAAAPSFGQETPAESVTLSLGSRVAPAGANDCVNGPCDGVLTGGVTPPWAGGAATANGLAYGEVGTMTLRAVLASGSYLGSGLSASGTSAVVGPFVPAYFDTAVTPGCGSFTYAGQPFTVVVTARNAAGQATLNYASLPGCTVCAKPVTLQDPDSTAYFNGTQLLPATAFARGEGRSDAVVYTWPSVTTAPATLTLRAIDASVSPPVTSGVSSATYPGHVEGTTVMRSGRLKLSGATGSGRASLQLPVQALYWSGRSWVRNSADACTVIPSAAVALSGYRDHRGLATSGWSTSATGTTLSGGGGVITLAAPSPAGRTGSVSVALNLGTTTTDAACLPSHPVTTGANLAHLRGMNGPCAASASQAADPSATATFGVYSGESRRLVHIRELF